MGIGLHSLRVKLLFASLCIELVMLGLLISNSLRQMENHLAEHTHSHIQAIEQAYKTAVAVPLVARDYATLRDILDGWLSVDRVHYLAVLDRDGHPLAMSGWPADQPLPAPTTEALGDITHVSFDVDYLGQVYGRVQYGLDTRYIRLAKDALFEQSMLIALAEIALSVLLLLGTSLWLTRHLAQLAEASERIAAGRLDTRVAVATRDEVGVLARAFNTMVAAVHQRIEDLRENEQRFRAIADYTYAWENWFGPDGRLRWVNPAVERMTGYAPADCLRMEGFPLPLVIPDDRNLVEHQQAEALQGHTGQDLEFRIQCRDGRVIWVAMAWQPIFDDGGNSLGFRSSLRDITLQHYTNEELAFHASHDALTGLYNRRAFEAHLDKALEQGARVVVLYIDLDQFKVINDLCGHAAGDTLLQHLAHVLQAKVGAGFLARLGGDEFGLILREVSLDEALRRAQHLIDDIRALPFAWEGRSFRLGASVGVAQSLPSLDSVTDLLIAADTACFAAKERGRNRVQLFNEEDAYFRERREAFVSLSEIASALEEGRFVLYGQRIQPLKGQEVSHAEVLVRMLSPSGELLPPSRFIPAAERFNMMPLIDRWVIENTCAQLRRWREAGQRDLPRLSINLSGATLGDASLSSFIRDTLAKHEVDPSAVCFEITESAAITQLDQAFAFIDVARSMGAGLSLDDFGSGLSSFAYLRQFRVDYLKIDGMFVKNSDRDAADRAVIESMVRLAQIHGLSTIAEFVTSPAVLATVEGLGVDYAQGFAVHVPAPLDSLLENRTTDAA